MGDNLNLSGSCWWIFWWILDFSRFSDMFDFFVKVCMWTSIWNILGSVLTFNWTQFKDFGTFWWIFVYIFILYLYFSDFLLSCWMSIWSFLEFSGIFPSIFKTLLKIFIFEVNFNIFGAIFGVILAHFRVTLISFSRYLDLFRHLDLK